ncbi:MAG: FMN-binding protein [Bacteroidales bacterium]|nr:FMN-binding protein [Bacteroidales bacterium]
MKFKNVIPYILIFSASFILTPILFTSLIKKANDNSKEYLSNFNPVTSNLVDGVYKGKYKAFRIITLSKVEFEIENGQVKTFNLLKLFRSPGSIYKDEFEIRIQNSKRLEIDAISGATRTSNFAKAAIKSAIDIGPIK